MWAADINSFTDTGEITSCEQWTVMRSREFYVLMRASHFWLWSFCDKLYRVTSSNECMKSMMVIGVVSIEWVFLFLEQNIVCLLSQNIGVVTQWLSSPHYSKRCQFSDVLSSLGNKWNYNSKSGKYKNCNRGWIIAPNPNMEGFKRFLISNVAVWKLFIYSICSQSEASEHIESNALRIKTHSLMQFVSVKKNPYENVTLFHKMPGTHLSSVLIWRNPSQWLRSKKLGTVFLIISTALNAPYFSLILTNGAD